MAAKRLARELFGVPGLLSLSRIPLAGAFALSVGRPIWSLGILAAAGASDILDGWYARRYGQETKTGAVLDPITDKVFVGAVVASLLFAGKMSVAEALLLGTRDVGEILIAGYFALTGQRKVLAEVRSANVAGKIATAMQYAAIVAIVVDNSTRSLLVGLAVVAGVSAFFSYWGRYDRPNRPLEQR
jgi:cardiolipin synthase (CMP-forming)